MSGLNEIKKFRTQKGLTQKALASLIGATQQAVAKWEKSTAEVGLKYVMALAKALGVPKELIFPELADSSTPPPPTARKNATDLCWPNEISLPNEVRNAAAMGKLAFFIGNGISRLYGLPSWDELSTRMLKNLAANGIIDHNKIDLLSRQSLKARISIADHYYKTNFGKDAPGLSYRAALLRDLKDTHKGNKSAYSSLAKCGAKFITTNYDSLLADALKRPASIVEPIVASDSKPDQASEEQISNSPIKTVQVFYDPYKFNEVELMSNKVVFHLHGSIEDENTIVASTLNYLKLYSDENIQTFLRRFFEKHVVVFLGYGLDELELLDLIIRTGRQASPTTQPNRFFLLLPLLSHETEILDQLEIYYQQLNMKLLPFSRNRNDYESYSELLEVWSGELSAVIREPTRVDELDILDSLANEFEGRAK